MKYAGFWMRLVAILLDTIILTTVVFLGSFIIGFVLGFVLALSGVGDQSVIQTVCGAAGGLFGFVVEWLYFAFMESSSWQATLGKKVLGLKVMDEEGQRIGFGRATGRYFAKIISCLTLLIGYIMAGFTEKKQALHDKIAGTLVCKAV